MQTLPRKIGVEIEFSCQRNPLAAIGTVLTGRGESVRVDSSYHASDGSKWDLKTDSSCGYEIATPAISKYSDLVNAARVTELITSNGGTVNERCGLHVHVDMGDITPEKFQLIMRFMARYENAFFLMAGPSRQSNHFCKKLAHQVSTVKTDPARFRSAWGDKYFWLNGTHLRGIGTLEFRLMESTLDSAAIVGWVMFLVHTVEYIIAGKKISWGTAKCASDRDLLQTMLGQAGFYGPFEGRDKATIVAARRWAISTYTKKISQDDKRVKPLTIDQFASLAQ